MPACQAAVRQVCFDTVTVMTAAARAMDQDNAMRLRRRLLQELRDRRCKLTATTCSSTSACRRTAATPAAALASAPGRATAAADVVGGANATGGCGRSSNRCKRSGSSCGSSSGEAPRVVHQLQGEAAAKTAARPG